MICLHERQMAGQTAHEETVSIVPGNARHGENEIGYDNHGAVVVLAQTTASSAGRLLDPLGAAVRDSKQLLWPAVSQASHDQMAIPWPSHPGSGAYSREIKTQVMVDHCTQKLVAMLFPAAENNPSSAQQIRMQSSRIPPSSSTTPLQPPKGTKCWLPAPTSGAPTNTTLSERNQKQLAVACVIPSQLKYRGERHGNHGQIWAW